METEIDECWQIIINEEDKDIEEKDRNIDRRT